MLAAPLLVLLAQHPCARGAYSTPSMLPFQACLAACPGVHCRQSRRAFHQAFSAALHQARWMLKSRSSSSCRVSTHIPTAIYRRRRKSKRVSALPYNKGEAKSLEKTPKGACEPGIGKTEPGMGTTEPGMGKEKWRDERLRPL